MSTNRPPSVETLLGNPGLNDLIARLGQPIVADLVRAEIDNLRQQLGKGGKWPTVDEIVAGVDKRAHKRDRAFPQPVVNATGVLLHTNLGRAPWGRFTLDQIADRLTSFTTLEFDITSGTRGKRGTAVETEIAALAEAEAALVVNNNAAAVYLVLTALAWDREVVISRGELVQIGGGFRIPEILTKSGAVLCEVGTTNKTALNDYRAVCGPQTALILKVHRSNFAQVGFVSEAGAKELSQLGQEYKIPVVWDLGSGAVGPGARCAYTDEPTLRAAIATGVDLVTCSGDKLLGGPQAGIIIGRKALVDKLRADPFYRAMRPGKATLLALEATVAAHRAGRAETLIPFYQLAAVPADTLKARAERIVAAVAATGLAASIIATEDTFGGGSAPDKTIAGWGVRVDPPPSPELLMQFAREHTPPILGTIADGAAVFALRTMFEADDGALVRFLTQSSLT